jgi:hypothetical protein
MGRRRLCTGGEIIHETIENTDYTDWKKEHTKQENKHKKNIKKHKCR